MAIDFNSNRNSKQTASGSDKEQRPKSQYWVNIGYNVEVPVVNEGQPAGTEERFVSLPVGLPLDIAQKTVIKGNDPEFVAMQTARNDLLEQLMAVAEKLEPGEAREINLVVQLRRINGEAPVIKSDANPFYKKLDL